MADVEQKSILTVTSVTPNSYGLLEL